MGNESERGISKSHEPRFQQKSFLYFSEKNKNFKISAVTGPTAELLVDIGLSGFITNVCMVQRGKYNNIVNIMILSDELCIYGSPYVCVGLLKTNVHFAE